MIDPRVWAIVLLLIALAGGLFVDSGMTACQIHHSFDVCHAAIQ